MPKQRTLWQEIKKKARDGRAPPCPACGEGGKIAGADIGQVTCLGCYTRWPSLRDVWKDAVKLKLTHPTDDGPKGA